jgi:hypothetical protein
VQITDELRIRGRGVVRRVEYPPAQCGLSRQPILRRQSDGGNPRELRLPPLPAPRRLSRHVFPHARHLVAFALPRASAPKAVSSSPRRSLLVRMIDSSGKVARACLFGNPDRIETRWELVSERCSLLSYQRKVLISSSMSIWGKSASNSGTKGMSM